METTSPAFRHTLPLQLRFNDIDLLGHVNNSVYFSFYDAGKGTVLMFDGHAEMRGRKSSQLKISFAEDGTPQDDREKP